MTLPDTLTATGRYTPYQYFKLGLYADNAPSNVVLASRLLRLARSEAADAELAEAARRVRADRPAYADRIFHLVRRAPEFNALVQLRIFVHFGADDGDVARQLCMVGLEQSDEADTAYHLVEAHRPAALLLISTAISPLVS